MGVGSAVWGGRQKSERQQYGVQNAAVCRQNAVSNCPVVADSGRWRGGACVRCGKGMVGGR